MFRYLILALAAAQTVTKGELEGIACSDDEYNRYKIIVCGKTLQTCELGWCKDYVHKWNKEFGACNQRGCPP